MIEANGKSIDYQINLQQFINQYQYSKENQLFERTLPHNINQIKQLLDNQPKKLSQQMKDLLKQEVDVYKRQHIYISFILLIRKRKITRFFFINHF